MNVILKKTWKAKANQYQTEKGFSFHGTINESDIDFINTRLGLISSCGKTGKLQFKMDNFGHFSASMNHDMQKYREEAIGILRSLPVSEARASLKDLVDYVIERKR